MENNINQTLEEDELLRQASREFSQRMKSYPVDIQIAVPIVMLNIIKGCPWGIVSSENKDFMAHLTDLRKSKYVAAYKLAGHNGRNRKDKYLVVANFKTMMGILLKEGKGIVEPADIEFASKKRDGALNRLRSFLSSGRFGAIAIFSSISSAEIIADGRRYPAFDVTLFDLIKECIKYKRNFVFGENSVEPDVLLDMYQKGQIDKVFETLQVAPSENGLFIFIDKPQNR